MLEKAVVEAVVAYAESLAWLHRKVVYQGRRGSPDDWFFGTGARIIIIEFKKKGEKPNVQQQREIARLRKYGFLVPVIDNIEDGKALFDAHS